MTSLSIQRIAIGLAALGMLGGCNRGVPEHAVEKVLARHFQAVATNGFDAAMVDYGEPFFEKTRRKDWGRELAGLSRKLGSYQNHTILWSRVFDTTGPFGPGTTVNVQSEVRYSKHSAVETFTLFEGAGDSGYKIAGHQIRLPEFLKNGTGT